MMTNTQSGRESGSSPRRTLSVTILAVGVLILAALNLTRAVQTVLNWSFLSDLLHITPIYMLLSGIIWTVTFLPLAWGLWRGSFWAPLFMQAASVAYALYYWADRLLLRRMAGQRANWPFALIVTLILLVWIWWTFSRTKVKAYFGDDE